MLARPVALLAPGATFTGVLPFGPFGEFPVKLVIHSIESPFGRIGAMVVCPAANAWVEGGDERGLITAAMGADEFFHLLQMSLLRFDAGLDDDFVPPFAVVFSGCHLPDGKTEEVKTCAAFMLVQRVCDVGFAWFHRQAHFSQPGFGQASGGL